MSKFRLIVYFNGSRVYSSPDFKFSIVIEKLNHIIDCIYDFNDRFDNKIFNTRDFSYSIEEVE